MYVGENVCSQTLIKCMLSLCDLKKKIWVPSEHMIREKASLPPHTCRSVAEHTLITLSSGRILALSCSLDKTQSHSSILAASCIQHSWASIQLLEREDAAAAPQKRERVHCLLWYRQSQWRSRTGRVTWLSRAWDALSPPPRTFSQQTSIIVGCLSPLTGVMLWFRCVCWRFGPQLEEGLRADWILRERFIDRVLYSWLHS